MGLVRGDIVETPTGDRGKVIHTSRFTVFVAFPRKGEADIVSAFLESQLTKIGKPPDAENNPPSAH